MPTDQELIKIVPSSRQLAYQATEFYAFFHFGMNTYTNREWGVNCTYLGHFSVHAVSIRKHECYVN